MKLLSAQVLKCSIFFVSINICISFTTTKNLAAILLLIRVVAENQEELRKLAAKFPLS